MAEDGPNRFLWHEGEVEGESDEDEIPREWPAYRRAYAALCRAQADSKDGVLGSNWQVLANSCSTTSLGTYKTGMRRLRQTHIWPGRSGGHTRSWSKSCVMPFEREKAAVRSKQSSMRRPWHTPWGWSASRSQNDFGRHSRQHSGWKRSQHRSGAVLRLCRSWHTKRIQNWSGVWWDSRYFQRCWASESARRPASASTGWGFWQGRRSSMTAKSTGLGLPVRFQEWPSNGCSSSPGLHKDAGTSTSSSDWSLRTNCSMSGRPFCVDPSGRTSGGMHGGAWAQRPCTRMGARSLASRRGSGGGAQERQWPTSTARTQGASGTHSQTYPPQLPQGEAMDCGNGNQAVYGVLGPESDSGDSTCSGSSSDSPSPRKADGRRGKRRRSA